MDEHRISERRACKAIGFCRMTIRYETSRGDDHGLRERMKALAHERRRFGYRRIHVLLSSTGLKVRLETKLQMPERRRPTASAVSASSTACPSSML